MIESHVTGPATCPTIAAQRNFQLARQHSGANKGSRQKPPFLLDTRLSSSPLLANSTRHSVTSRIERNSRLLCYLIFSTRHLNATLEKYNLVEKFNTFLRSDFDGSLESLNHLKIRPAPKFAPKALPMSQVLYVSGAKGWTFGLPRPSCGTGFKPPNQPHLFSRYHNAVGVHRKPRPDSSVDPKRFAIHSILILKDLCEMRIVLGGCFITGNLSAIVGNRSTHTVSNATVDAPGEPSTWASSHRV
jgi:hypothetical protein